MSLVNKLKIIKIIFFFTLSFIFLVIDGLLVFQKAYAKRIYPRTYYYGQKISGLNISQAQRIIAQKNIALAQNKITFIAGEKTYQTALANTGLQINPDTTAENAFQNGHRGSWLRNFVLPLEIIGNKFEVAPVASFDNQQYQLFIKDLEKNLNVSPQDAALSLAEGAIEKKPEITGITVTTADLPNKLIAASASQSQPVKLASKTLPPKVKLTDLAALEQKTNTLLEKKITLTYQNRQFSPDKKEIAGWIDLSQGTEPVYTDEKIVSYLNKVAASINTPAVNRSVNQTSQTVIYAGRPGLYLDVPSALTQLKKDLNKPEIVIILNIKTQPPATLIINEKILGYSAKNRPVKGYIYGSGPEAILFIGSIHGGAEKNPTTLLNELVKTLSANPALVSANKKAIIIPTVNPDGYAERSDKLNTNDVNLNLNFPTSEWANYGGENHEFAGNAPFTEKESQIIRDVVSTYQVKKMVSYHAQGALVNPEYSHALSEELARWYSQKSGYRYFNDVSWYYPGTATRWFVETTGNPAITVELSTRYSSEWNINSKAILELIG